MTGGVAGFVSLTLWPQLREAGEWGGVFEVTAVDNSSCFILKNNKNKSPFSNVYVGHFSMKKK